MAYTTTVTSIAIGRDGRPLQVISWQDFMYEYFVLVAEPPVSKATCKAMRKRGVKIPWWLAFVGFVA